MKDENDIDTDGIEKFLRSSDWWKDREEKLIILTTTPGKKTGYFWKLWEKCNPTKKIVQIENDNR